MSLDKPEFEPEFYDNQIKLMEKRYSKLFQKWGIKWEPYIKYITPKLQSNKYWIWIFLCGFEKFIKEKSHDNDNIRKRIYEDADTRIWAMIKDDIKNQEYMRQI